MSIYLQSSAVECVNNTIIAADNDRLRTQRKKDGCDVGFVSLFVFCFTDPQHRPYMSLHGKKFH